MEAAEPLLSDDGGVLRPSMLKGRDKSAYSAIARLCCLRLEAEERKDELLGLVHYYGEIYDGRSDRELLLKEAYELASSPATGDESLPRIASLIRRAMGEKREGVKG